MDDEPRSPSLAVLLAATERENRSKTSQSLGRTEGFRPSTPRTTIHKNLSSTTRATYLIRRLELPLENSRIKEERTVLWRGGRYADHT